MPFRFSLATVLRLRQLDQQAAQRAVQEAYRAIDILQQRMTQIEAERHAARQATAPTVGVLRVGQLISGGRYDLQLEAQLLELRQQLGQLNQELDRRRAVLQRADSAVRQIERLREAAQERYRLAELAREQRELDELAVQRHWRSPSHDGA